ncbi:MAG: ATP-dependent helicase HrpB [Tepidisphaeraceae bacterium]|jgi:ATP-dependent helicase HrpB
MPQLVPLPIDPELPRITRALNEARSLVIVAEPGAGKTTRVPPAILRAGLLSPQHPNLVMLQPRRVAARAAAMRIAQENGWTVGNEIGYHIRFEKHIGPQTRLRVLTEGILTRQLIGDPFLDGVGAVVLDEFHERSIHSDLAVAMLRELRQTVREDLLIVIMSATLEAEKASQFLSCPVVAVPGRSFPIDIQYHPHAAVPATARVVRAVETELEQPGGHILAFLPGADEIRRAIRQLEPAAAQYDAQLLPLHGSLPSGQQLLALAPSPRRKIILATNIAETSLTIDGVTVVIDSGLARVPWFDAVRGLDRLELKRISKASATQRAGRAGRTAPGRCVRLWSQKEHAALEDFELAEVHRVDLCPAVLDLHVWGKPDPRAFGWFESPPQSAIASAEQLLQMLGAVDASGVSDLGKRLIKLPVHPRLGRLLCAAADEGCAQEGAALAALLSEKDILRSAPPEAQPRGPSVKADSDLLLRLDLLENPREERLDPLAVRQVNQARAELLRLVRRLGHQAQHRPAHQTLLKLILWAYPDRVCRRRTGDPAAAVMVGGGGVRLAGESAVRLGEFFLALDARHEARIFAREALVRIASAIRPDWLPEMFPQSISRRRNVLFDPQHGRVVAVSSVCYRDLTLSEERDSAVDADQAAQVLAAALRPRAAEIFRSDESAADLLARVALLRKWMPEHPWPAFDEAELADALSDACRGKKSVAELTGGNLVAALEARLIHPLDRLLHQHAPQIIAVPSGSRIRLTYAPSGEQPPVLAVRLQEIFGWTDTPRIAAGRVRVLLHLLGPNYRPVQITDDLKSFWSTTYFQVRKDLRVRYPRHSWPDDPLTAAPQAKGGRKRP